MSEFSTVGSYYFESPSVYETDALAKKWQSGRAAVFQSLVNDLRHAEPFQSAEIERMVKQFMENNSLGMGQVLPVLRISIAGTMQGPPIYDMMSLLGKEICVERLNLALRVFQEKLG